MKNLFKPHLEKVIRMRTSVGRDLQDGIYLDRNERVVPFSDDIFEDILRSIPKYALNAYPDSIKFYNTLSDWLGLPGYMLYVTNGITEAIRVVFETIVSAGDKVVTISPTYPMYKVYSDIYQADLCEVKFDSKLNLDLEKLLNSIDNQTSLVCLPNPNLPIESALNEEQIRKIADKCQQYEVAFVVDEAYCFFGAYSAIGLVNEYDNMIVFQTFSKALGLAGARLGYMVSNKENIEYLSKTRSLVESNALSMAVGDYILNHPELMDDYIKQINEGRDYVKNELLALGIKYSGGTFTNGMLIFFDNKNDAEKIRLFLKEKNIYIRGSFGDPIDNCVRLTLGPKVFMEKFISGFKQALESILNEVKTNEV